MFAGKAGTKSDEEIMLLIQVVFTGQRGSRPIQADFCIKNFGKIMCVK